MSPNIFSLAPSHGDGHRLDTAEGVRAVVRGTQVPRNAKRPQRRGYDSPYGEMVPSVIPSKTAAAN